MRLSSPFQSRNRDAFHFRRKTMFRRKRTITFQSRNRDAFHFRQRADYCPMPSWVCFNLAIEMLFISGSDMAGERKSAISAFQSRNRDAFHFREAPMAVPDYIIVGFQSRNRDAFHFRKRDDTASPAACPLFQSRNRDAFHFRLGCIDRRDAHPGFNLAIEMLFISGHCHPWMPTTHILVSISQSRCFSFQANASPESVTSALFQSRNRDAFQFRVHADAH